MKFKHLEYSPYNPKTAIFAHFSVWYETDDGETIASLFRTKDGAIRFIKKKFNIDYKEE